jgi:protein-L-isoaspartate(D-aspartate) O-methyltransferase
MSAVHRKYAEEVASVAGIESRPLVEAFARVPREDFLGPGPWDVVVFTEGRPAYRRTPDADPERLLHNVAVAIDSARHLNNGHPSSLMMLIDSLRIGPSDSVLHVGAGVGYYTAILAELAARVVGIEVDEKLAARARTNVARWPNAEIFAGDGSETRGTYDAILVNAGATHPRAEWLEALRPGGRLLVPITVSAPAGAMPMVQVPFSNPGMLLLVRDGEARFTGPIYIFDCAGARDPALEPALRSALFGGRWKDVHRVRRDSHPAGPDCIVHGAGSCLAA